MPIDPHDHHTRLAVLEDWRERTEGTLSELRDNIGKILDMQSEARGAQQSTDRTIKLGLGILGVLISLATLVTAWRHP